jgi:hypothetical protein
VISASLRPDGSVVVGPGQSSVVILGATSGRLLVQRSPLASISEIPEHDADEDLDATALSPDLEGVAGLPGFGGPSDTVLTVLAAPTARTVAELRALVDGVRAGETGDAGEVSLVDCVPLLARFTAGVYRDGVRPAAPVDDIAVGTRSIEQDLVRGPGWRNAPDYAGLVDLVPPGGMVLVLEQYRVGLGHAYALAHTADAGVVDVDPQLDAASRIRQAAPDLRNLVDARFLAIDASGRAVLDPLTVRPDVSTARALADPPAVHDYGSRRETGRQVLDEHLQAEPQFTDTHVMDSHAQPEALDERFGPAVPPKKVKDYERDDQGDVRVNPLWYRLEDFKPALLERVDGRWLYAIDEHGEVFIGSEEVASLIEPEELDRLLAGMQSKDPDLTKEFLLEKLKEQGVPTIAVGFDENTGATHVRDGRVGGELLFNPLTQRWQIDASSRYMGPQVRPGVEFDTITEWVNAAAERMSAVLHVEVTAMPADAPRLGDGAHVAGTGTAEHTERFGPLAGPKKVKDSELNDEGQVRVNPLWYRLEDFKPALLERTSGVWHYAVDEDGHILIGSEEPLTLIEDGELRKLLEGMQSRNPDLTMEELKAALVHQGHPSITVGFTDEGTTRVRPARIAGELAYNKDLARWELNDKSGRYMSFKIRPGLKADVAGLWLRNAADRISEALHVSVTPVLFKNAEPAPVPETVPAEEPAAQRFGGVPTGVGWGHARWARSWGLRFDSSEGTGTLYDALLSAGGGSLTLHGQALSDADEARQALGEPLGAVEPEAGALSEAATRLGASLLILRGDGTISAHGQGPALVVAETAADASGAQDARHWVGLPPASTDSGLSGVSGAQIHWAVTEAQRFVGPRGGFFDTLANLGRASGVAVLDRNPQDLRGSVVGWMRTRATTRDWSEIFTRAGIEAPLHDAAAREKIIADVQRDGDDSDSAMDRLLPMLAGRSFGVRLQVVDPGGGVRVHGAADAEPLLTVAPVRGSGAAHSAWLGLAPVRTARSLGAATRPADVPGGLGWDDHAVSVMMARGMADSLVPVHSGSPASAAQQDWARDGGRQLVEVPEGPDALLEAIVRATGGGFTAKGVYVGDAGSLRALMADDVRPALDADAGLSLVVHTIWSAHSDTDAGLGHSAAHDAAFDSGRAVQEIAEAIRNAGGRQTLADELVPYFANRLGLGVRVVDPSGVVGRYGEGRPVYVAWSEDADGGRRWMAAPPTESRYALGSPLHAPNVSDPALVHLNRAIDARKRALRAGGTGESEGDGVVGLLREAQARWLVHTGPPRQAPVSAVDAPEPVAAPREPRQQGASGSGFMQSLRTASRWLGYENVLRPSESLARPTEPRRWEATVEGLVQVVHAPFGGTGWSSGVRDADTEADLRSGVGLSMAIGLFDALFPRRFALESDVAAGGEASRERVLEAVERGEQALTAGGFARRSVTLGSGGTAVAVVDPRRITNDPDEQRILWSWMGSGYRHEFASLDLLRKALNKAKPWHVAGGERPELYTRAHLQFLTQADGRAPTLYFVDGDAGGRIRQQHSHGPFAADHLRNLHFFFKSERHVTAFAAKASYARRNRLQLNEGDLAGIRYSLTPTDGDLHYEVSFNSALAVTVTHRSGGRVVTDLAGYDDDRIARIFRAAIGTTDPIAADRSQRAPVTAAALRQSAARPAERWVTAPLPEVVAAIPPEGAALVLLEGGRSVVVVDTPGGLRLVDFGAHEVDGGLAGRVSVPSRASVDALAGGGPAVALVVDGTGHPLSAEQLTEPAIGARFDAALGWRIGPGPTRADGTGAADAWAARHRARLVSVDAGPNSVFDAALAAAGGRLNVRGVEVSDALQLRKALAGHLRERLAAPNATLRDFPSLHAAFAFEGADRVIEEFFDNNPAAVDPRAVHRQVDEHIDSGKAARYLVEAMAEPGHWEQITRLAALDALADATGRGFLVVGPDGRTHLHGELDSPRLAVARLGSDSAAPPHWGALVPDEAHPEAFDAATADTVTSLGRRAESGPAAGLTERQRETAASARLDIGPARTGPDALYHAVLDASGDAVQIDRDTLVNTPAELRSRLTGLLLTRPDLLDEAARRAIGRETALGDHPNDEELLSALTDPADRDAEVIARHLVGTYFGLELRVVEPDGTRSTYGTGRPVTVAHTAEEHGNLWAALTPEPRTAERDLARGVGPEADRDPRLPEITDAPLDQAGVSSTETERLGQAPWAPDTFAVQLPGETHPQSPWRSATFCAEVEVDGVMQKACVDVAVLTLDAELAARLGVPLPAGR